MIAQRGVAPLVVLGVDLVVAAGTWLGWNASGHHGAHAALAVLVLANPVGMLLAVNLPRWLTYRAGRSIGLTTVGDRALERWQQVQTLVLDPFRSLTTGHLVVTEVHPVDPDHERNLRWFAGALAHSYDDPVGRAVAKLAGPGRVSNVALEPGLGIRGSVDRHPVRVGTPQWLGFSDEDSRARIGTTVAVDVDQRPLGRITVADEVRPDAARQLDRLRRAGLNPVLASTHSEEEMERLATSSASPAWHAETDPLQLARELTVGGKHVGLVQAEPDGTGTLRVVDSTDQPSTSDPTDSLGLTTPSIDTVVQAVVLAGSAHRSQRRALRLAWLLALLPLPFACFGLVPPLVGVVVAAVSWVVIAGTGAAELVGLQVPPVPVPVSDTEPATAGA